MKPYRFPMGKFLPIALAIASVTSFLIKKAQIGLGLESIVLVGGVSFVIGVFWLLFDKIFWKWSFFRNIGLSDLPDLNGTWYGDVNRIGENNPHSFCMKIYQTYSHISIQTNTENSKGNSISANFLMDDTGKNFDLINYWDCQTLKLGTEEIIENFRGFSRIDIKEQNGEIVLEDYYFTNRNPKTEGKNRLIREYR